MITTAGRTAQGERSRTMRLRLMEATVACLVENGWRGTTTTLVSQRAGVSRGAQLHHFPTKSALVLAAVEHVAAARRADLDARMAELPPGPHRTRAVLELLSELVTGPLFAAALELWVAARTDAELRAAVIDLEERVGRAAHRSAAEALRVDDAAPGARELVQATLDLVRGLGLANTLSDDGVRRGRILDEWAATLDARLNPA